MQFYLMTAIGCIIVTFLLPLGQPHENVRIDSNSNNLTNQDIFMAFNISRVHWLFGFNYKSPHTEGKSCVFFDIEQLSKEGMNYSSNFEKNGTSGKIEYTGTFCSTNIREGVERPYFEALFATLRNGSWPMYYTLEFSDNNGCSVFNVENITNSVQDTKLNVTKGCMVLLSNSVETRDMSSNCTAFYRNSCGENIIDQVFQNSCRISTQLHTSN
uniref:Putative lipocalin-2 1 lipocalin n=1 Tax=Amblyomma aureolatum TaxID=187763 RepID=A0A1E1X6W3_9ACAR